MSRLPQQAPSAKGLTTETVTKTTYTETTVKRVTNNVAKPVTEDVTLVKSGGPLGLSIIGGSDHSCVPFGTGEPGIFISKVSVEFEDREPEVEMPAFSRSFLVAPPPGPASFAWATAS